VNKRFIMLLSSLLVAGKLAAATQVDDVKTIKLSNGMTIAVLEDHSIPNANMYLFWRVGSRNEYPGITGLSHFFEHMMFNGAKKYGPKQFDRVMEANGGANNAYTTENNTVYTNWFPANALETIFSLEADRIAHLAIEASIVESERGVVTSERSTGLENSNFRMLHEEVKGTAFRAHPYSWSVLGHQSDIDNWSMQDLEQYHKTYYAPNNAFVVIAGDVTVAQVQRLAQQYFEPIPAQPMPRAVHTVEPEQKGERRVYVQKPSVSSPTVMMAFHVPATNHADHYPLQMLSNILGNGSSSRLNRALVDEKQLATEVFSYMPDSFDPNLIYLYASGAKGVTASQLEQAMIVEINAIIEHGITDIELAKVKNSAQVDFYRQLATINGKANNLGSYQLFHGHYNKMFTVPADLAKVSKDDVQRVVKTYLRRSNRTVGVLDAKADSQAGDL
jgi:zinc protease